jgi:uncharacterized protein (TIGR01777 family)
MKILIAGATGMVGQALVKALEADHTLVLLGRDPLKLKQCFAKHTAIGWQAFLDTHNPLDDIDVVINLAGENIGEGRWSVARKDLIISSRVNATHTLATACAHSANKNIRLLNASAIGVYGRSAQPDQIYDEQSPISNPPKDFLSTVGRAWEEALAPAEQAGVSVVKMRFGVVLSKNGGALAKMLPAFKFGLGGPIGSGQQSFSWVSLHDLIRAITWLIQHPEITGPVNIVAPEWVTQRQFAKMLGKILHRPAVLPLPAAVVKLQFGQMGQELLLNGIAVRSSVLIKHGFEFSYPKLEGALDHL